MRRLVITLAALLLVSAVFAADPPRGLKWGMKPDEIAKALASDPDEVILGAANTDKPHRGYREYPEMWLQKSYTRREIKHAKVNGKKAERAELFLDSTDALQSFHYVFLFDNNGVGNRTNKGYSKAWVFHSDLKSILSQKYGKPTKDEATENERDRVVASGSKYATEWTDSTGSKISLFITRQTHDMLIATIDAFLVILIYDAPGYRADLLHKDLTDSKDI
jgi:hypothetical protein